MGQTDLQDVVPLNATAHYADEQVGFFDQLAILLNSDCAASVSKVSFNESALQSQNQVGPIVLPEDALFYVANAFFLVSYLSPNNRYGQLVLHGGLVVGFLLFSTWAWNVACAPDVFAWYFGFVILNIGQSLYILYKMRPIQFDSEVEVIYEKYFAPIGVRREQFQRLLGGAYSAKDSSQSSRPGGAASHSVVDKNHGALMMSLHSGECYAIQNMTKTDRLALLVSGRVNVLNERTFLHHIEPGEFLDSPEFESTGPNISTGAGGSSYLCCSSGDETTFNVTVCAAVPSRCLVWKRSSLEYLFVKDTHLATAMTTLISRDITHKLFSMNVRLRRSVDGANLDIRLPGIAGRISQMDPRQMAKFTSKSSSMSKNDDKEEEAKSSASKSLHFAPPLLIPIQKKPKAK